MTCGTLQPSQMAGVARPVAGGDADLFLGIFGGIAMPAPQAASKQTTQMTWIKEWNVRPAYPVIHTDRSTQRPLERSP